MARTKTASEAIISVLKRGPKRGLTAAAIAERAGLNLNTARTTLYQLVATGNVANIGRETPSFGRPANLYALAYAA
jgi:predicted ArsR family transcriptional regulator